MASNSFQHRRAVQQTGDISPMAEEDVLRLADEGDIKFKRVNWHNTKLIVRTCLSSEEYEDTVRNILDYCRTGDGGMAVEMIDFAERANIIAAYALLEMPQDYEKLFRVVYASDLYETVCGAVSKAQVDAIKRSVKIYMHE
jgi:hypothetical protein